MKNLIDAMKHLIEEIRSNIIIYNTSNIPRYPLNNNGLVINTRAISEY